ncbi:hypothetical protein N7520_003106 [Penicillium odoratum]|uniref:uncharacterized protein n=1 Tax=Penicillium odoratum TaxID=1167516 RepID=UPI0025487AB9|nr:uncharacterized protein N7520_003106 [Penicillium odoratum]KAJ5772577.1 hypothetical protein N7520_003106 [Penicillium odoratum]
MDFVRKLATPRSGSRPSRSERGRAELPPRSPRGSPERRGLFGDQPGLIAHLPDSQRLDSDLQDLNHPPSPP